VFRQACIPQEIPELNPNRMDPKKTVRADLTRKSFLFFNIGLVTSLSLAIFAFTFKTEGNKGRSNLIKNQEQIEELIDIPITEQQPPPPPKIEQPQIVEVPDTEKINEDIQVDMDIETTSTETKAVLAPVRVEIEEEDSNTLFTIVEESASPIGGISAFNEFVARNIVYPTQARRMSISGKVFIEFVVERDGTLTNIKTLKGIGGGCDEEAVRVVGLAPKWKPAKQRGRVVRQKMVLPIHFSTN
jgi:periplasmic protein TonB